MQDNVCGVNVKDFGATFYTRKFGTLCEDECSIKTKGSTNCEGNVCHTTVCIDKNCQTSVSNPAELVRQLKSHGLPSNVIQQFLNSPLLLNPSLWTILF